MIWSFLKFFAMLMGLIASIHWFIYKSSIQFLPPLNTSACRHVFLRLIVFLALSFPLFLLVNHFWGGVITRFLNVISGTWFALAIYLAMAFISLWILKGILVILPISQEKLFLLMMYGVWVSMVIVLFYMIGGLINAISLKATRVDVAIKDLPAYWEGKTIMQVSDVHLGTIWGEGRLRQIVKIAKENNPEVIAMTGDLFDGSTGKQQMFAESLRQLSDVKPGHIFFTSGNHERYASYKNCLDTIQQAHIHLLENDLVNVHGLQFIGISYPDLRGENKTPDEFHFHKHPDYKKGRPSVLLYHTPTDFHDNKLLLADIQRKAYINPETNFENANKAGIDLQLSGHTHGGQFAPFVFLTKIIYHGFHYGLHRVGDFQIYISTGAGTWGPPIRHIAGEVALLRLTRDKEKNH